jgi:hypothetical protein
MEQKAMEKRVVDVMLRACTALGNPILETIGHDLLTNPMEAANFLEGSLTKWNRNANKPAKEEPSPPEPEKEPRPERASRAAMEVFSQEELDALLTAIHSGR